MAQKRDPRGSALCALRDQLRQGRHRPGAPLTISDIAQELGLSPTPIREALAHLAGEGLIQERRGLGYFADSLDSDGLAELYQLHQLYVVAALAAPRRRGAGPAPGAEVPRTDWADVTAALDPAQATEVLFAALVAASGARALALAHRRLSDRLGPSRRVEDQVLGDLSVVLAELVRLSGMNDRTGLRIAIELYHQKRVSAAPDIVAALRNIWA